MTDYNSLSDLLSPVSVDSFVTQHFATRPLHIQGAPDRFADLFSRADFDRIARTGRVRVRCLYRDDQERIIRETGERPTITLQPSDIPSARSAGATVFLTGIQREHARVAKVAAMLKQSLGFTGEVRASTWMSGPRSGIAPHFDAGSAFIFQIEGRKVWRLSKQPAMPWPRTCGLQMPEGDVVFEAPPGSSAAIEPWEENPRPFEAEDTIEVALEPGHLLYLPFGVWHTTRADEDGPSLSVNVHLEPIDVGELLFEAMRAKLRERVEWRGTFAQECGPEMPANVLQWFRARLAELPRELEALSRSPQELERAWKMRVAAFDGVAPRPTADPHAIRSVRLSSERPVTAAIDRETVTFWCGTDEIVIDEPELLEAATKLARREPVTAEELTRDVVSALLERGLVEAA